MAHSVYQVGAPLDFVVFNDGELSMEEIDTTDLTPCSAKAGSSFASAAWSCNCSWYFVITDDGIALLNVYTNKGFFCRKKSAKFIELFLEHKKSRRKYGS